MALLMNRLEIGDTSLTKPWFSWISIRAVVYRWMGIVRCPVVVRETCPWKWQARCGH